MSFATTPSFTASPLMAAQPLLAERIGPLMHANAERVLLRRLYPGSHEKAFKIVERVSKLSESELDLSLASVMEGWGHRHENLRGQLRHRYREVCLNLRVNLTWTEERKLLLGSYFLMEYSVESAALFNPSIVLHPNQNDLEPGFTRVVISLRATGEGHVSSVTFREAILTPHNRLILLAGKSPLKEAKRMTSDIDAAKFLSELKESHMRTKAWKPEQTAFVNDFMDQVAEHPTFTVDKAREVCAELLKKYNNAEGAEATVTAILMLVEANYTVVFEGESALSQRVIFPSAPSQSNGIEDARFVRFNRDDGTFIYYATFTAYNGRTTLSQMMETTDFHSFRFVSLSGDVREKGMALFPRKIHGHYAMLTRQDDMSVLITFSRSLYKWEDPSVLLGPEQPWELFKMGNCGSPIETPEGWIVITHGMGPMRKYCLGAALLDLDDPTKVIGRLREPLIVPNEAEREGYVPNVVYSCGSMLHGGDLIIPYAMSDSVSSFARVSISSLLEALQAAPPKAQWIPRQMSIAPNSEAASAAAAAAVAHFEAKIKAQADAKAAEAEARRVAEEAKDRERRAATVAAAATAAAVAEKQRQQQQDLAAGPLSGNVAAQAVVPKTEGVKKIVLVGDYLPRKCGIATFTHDLRNALAKAHPGAEVVVVAVNDNESGYTYSKEVVLEFKEQEPSEYLRVADWIAAYGADLVCVQHEYGIYGGFCGVMLLDLLRALRCPIVVTLHTILEEPNPDQRRILASILSASSLVITMAQKGLELLSRVYQADPHKVRIIQHGIPEMDYPDTKKYKAHLGFETGRKVVLTFGLLSPNKGIEFALEALAKTKKRTNDFLYVILGQTHPGIIKHHGEMYRHGLEHQAKELGISDNVVFIDQFVDLELLKEYIAACDIYLTPYLHEQQITSGTLSYAFGMGSCVVSTPYWHAVELLADGRGTIVPFRDSDQLSNVLADLLLDDDRRIAMKRRAFEHGRTMTWPMAAHQYMEAFEAAATTRKHLRVAEAPRTTLPACNLDHLLRLTDDTGLIQHARFTIPDRAHGYCVDDNARALLLFALLKCSKFNFGHSYSRVDTYFAFVTHALCSDRKRFRNFMSFDRRWLEEQGSEDSHGRTLWAVGACARYDVHRDASTTIFLESFNPVFEFQSPRSWAFTILGTVEFLHHMSHHEVAGLRDNLLERLIKCYEGSRYNDWEWFEEIATYDNAVLPHALLVGGSQANNRRAVEVGLKTLEWIYYKQLSPGNLFVPIGNDGWASRTALATFDQQPLEASSMAQACMAAETITGDPLWSQRARLAFDWFMGRNLLGKALYDPHSHGCCDGLHSNRVNLNQGGESTLAFLLALVSLKRQELVQIQPATPKLGFSAALTVLQ